MNTIRQYFVLKRIQAGASNHHLLPHTVSIDSNHSVQVVWGGSAESGSNIDQSHLDTDAQLLEWRSKRQLATNAVSLLENETAGIDGRNLDAIQRNLDKILHLTEKIDSRLAGRRLGLLTTPVTSVATAVIARDVVIDQMCIAVHNLHALRIIHRNIRMSSFGMVEGRVVMREWQHAAFNPGNSPYSNQKRNEFAYPDWGETAPEMSGDEPDRTRYGFEYDMWCLGLVIFELIYDRKIQDEIDIAEYTEQWLDEWIAARPLPQFANISLYTILLRVILIRDPVKRAGSYAAMNMTDGPRNQLFSRQMEVVEESPTGSGIKCYRHAPPVSEMLSCWLENPDVLLKTLRDHARARSQFQCAHCIINRKMKDERGYRDCRIHGYYAPPPLPAGEWKAKSECTRVMYAMMRSTRKNNSRLGHSLIAIYRCLANALLTDLDQVLDPDEYGFASRDEFDAALVETAIELSDFRIRL